MDEQRTANSPIDDYIASFPSIMSKIPSRAWLITIAERSSTVRVSFVSATRAASSPGDP